MLVQRNPSREMSGEGPWCCPTAWSSAGALVVLLLLALGLGASASCSDDSGPIHPQPDAGAQSLRLAIRSPGRDVGLFSGGTVSLVVRLENGQGVGQAGRTVSFSMDGDPAGSVLEQAEAVTDDDGLASVTLRAGWTPTSFSVDVEAGNAAPVRFDVVVSDAGFGALDMQISGEETASGATPVSVILYFDEPCAQITSQSQPAKVRTVSDYGDTVLFEFLPVDRFISVYAKTAPDESGRVQSGCLDLPVGSLRENLTLRGHVMLVDETPALASGYFLETQLELQPTPGGLLDSALGQVRRIGSCPNAAGTVLFDCLVAALSHPNQSPEELDCNGEALTDLAASLDRARGILDGRCRGDRDGQGAEGLEALVLSQVANQSMVTRIRSLGSGAVDLGALTIRSYLQLHPTSLGDWVGQHRLVSVWITGTGDSHSVSLNKLGLSGRSTSDFSVTPLLGTKGLVIFGAQQFLFRPALVLEHAVARWLFDTAEDEPLTAGFARLFGADSGDLDQACGLLDAAVCARVGESPGCLGGSCRVALQALAWNWDRAFGTASVTDGVDLRFEAGRAALHDEDGNLLAESVGSADQPGQWDAVVLLADEELQPSASFSGIMAPGEVF